MEELDRRRILEFLEANYGLFDGKTDDQAKIITWSWYEVIKPYSFNDVLTACKQYLANNKSKPKPCDIKAELDTMRAKRHTVHAQITNNTEYDADTRLTRQNFSDIIKREFTPFLYMRLPEHVKEVLLAKHKPAVIDDFITHAWGYIMHSDFKVIELEIALGTIRGTKFTFKQFMKALLNAHEHNEEMKANPNKLEALKEAVFAMTQPKAA
ncbi:hypothetical protein [Francisella philomiragia]|uniref:Replicative helicase inhibitor G39P N-terminal domain-containing protein n=1 Tax=Francisella philomiragia TaxID=28110 RepID=A0ABS1GAE2_9GAMM|nr:hypothetical protein [Francisella philomiragia]MBK2258419.1 hypothetical protein [Francisella philomiragia]MBK2301783.1 hypothetical protein [Francisella philomiragia]